MDYWAECVSEALDEAGITATPQQISMVAEYVSGAHDNYGMAHGHDCIPNPLAGEVKQLKTALDIEKRKVVCPDCRGTGTVYSTGPYHCSTSQCSSCRGDGKVTS